MPRFARRVDATQAEIVEAIRACGWQCWFIGEPADLLCYRAGVWRVLECKVGNRKDGTFRQRSDQAKQNEFVYRTNTPIVCTAEQAIKVLEAR